MLVTIVLSTPQSIWKAASAVGEALWRGVPAGDDAAEVGGVVFRQMREQIRV
ncbi:hypothetical protein BH11PLA1_BH11PLA1_22990 [soil metagenome]